MGQCEIEAPDRLLWIVFGNSCNGKIFFLIRQVGEPKKSKMISFDSNAFIEILTQVAGFGFCCYIGVEFISLNLAAPFLLFGIGVDDTFVVLSSWHRSSPHLSVPERMGR